MHISHRLVLVVLLLCVFFAFMFSLFSLLLYVFIDVRLSHLNKDYLLTYLIDKYWCIADDDVCMYIRHTLQHCSGAVLKVRKSDRQAPVNEDLHKIHLVAVCYCIVFKCFLCSFVAS